MNERGTQQGSRRRSPPPPSNRVLNSRSIRHGRRRYHRPSCARQLGTSTGRVSQREIAGRLWPEPSKSTVSPAERRGAGPFRSVKRPAAANRGAAAFRAYADRPLDGCSLPGVRPGCGKRAGDVRPAAVRRPRPRRGLPFPERAGPRARLAPLGHPPALARHAARRSSGSTATSAASTASASTPGAATTGCSASAASCSAIPYHYRDARTDGVMEAVFAARRRAPRIYDDHRHPVPPVQHALPAHRRRAQRTPRLLDAATGFGTIPDILNYWLTGVLRAEYTNATTTQMVDARTRNWADATAAASSTSRRACCRRWSSRARCSAA